MPSEKSLSPLSRAAIFGFALGLTLAGGVLMVLAIRTLTQDVDCVGADMNQCIFEANLAHDFARMQMWMGIALEVLSVGCLLWLRSQLRANAAPPAPPEGPPPS